MSRTAIPAAHATGFPPNVFEWTPCCPKSSRASKIVAPIGIPDPRDFASVMMSGTAFVCSTAKSFPVRPIPLWTSSATRRAPLSFVIFSIRSTHPGGGTTYPPSPWIGSKNVAARSPGGMTVFMYRSSMMFAQYRSHDGYVSLYGHRKQYAYGTWTAPGIIGENRARWTALLPVRAREPIVRPWNPWRNARKSGFPEWWRASLIAASFASVPLFAKNTFFGRAPGARSASRSARRVCTS